MTPLQRSKDVALDSNQSALEELARAIEWNVGEFALILARCNCASLQKRLVQALRERCSVEIRQRVLDKSFNLLYTTIQTELGQHKPQALMVFDLESVSALDQLLTAANQVREEFRKNFHFPLVLWVTDEVLQKLIRLAPDFYSWATTVEFTSATGELIHFIQQAADEVFAKVLDAGLGIFLDNAAINLGIGSPRRTELESAWNELQRRCIRLDPELEASLEFVLGRDANGSLEQSRQHLERSLALLEQQERRNASVIREQENSVVGAGLEDNLPGKEPSLQQNPPSSKPKLLERVGCVLYSLGLWWRTYATRHRAEHEQACGRAKDYFQQCIEVFEQGNRKDLVVKFINALGIILQRLQQWDELEAVAQKALALHQTYPDPFRLARAYGFLAQVALAKSDWNKAEQSAQQAVSILTSGCPVASTPISSEQSAYLDWECSFNQGWYLLSLARAQRERGRSHESLKNLETARAQTKPQYDPELYIQILEELRSLYFEQGDYLKAFEIKQDQRSIEQQYGFRAFVGAGRLQPKQQVINPVLAPVEAQRTLTQEITASGRQQDVNRLVERIGRHDHKLTVIYGQSGVGKSSIVQAGLIPALKHKPIGTRDVLAVLQRVYTNWIRILGQSLAEGLEEARSISLSATLDSIVAILEQLRKNAEHNLLSVLIFDQFEEFFFVCKEPSQRRVFYDFLRECLNVQYVKVILSLREDYLHYLLEFNRLVNLEVINNNILDKNIIYYLGKFSPSEAQSVIQSLTEQTQFSLEPLLIDALVQDLAGELGEVRPIELQVVGAQLQTEKITTLAQYREQGSSPKEKLVGRYLAEVVKDCGSENEQTAQLVLYLLTDENNTRPLKTRPDLEKDLKALAANLAAEADKLSLVLEIFVKSGLVVLLQEFPTEHYQLVHDYLVSFIRHEQGSKLLAQLKDAQEQRKLSEQKLNRFLKRVFSVSVVAVIILTISTVSAVGFWLLAEYQKRQVEAALGGFARAIIAPNQKLDVLKEAIRAGQQLKMKKLGKVKPDT